MTRSSKRRKISKISKIVDDPAYFELDPAQVERVSKLDQTTFNILNILANDPTTLASIDTEKLVEIIRDFFRSRQEKTSFNAESDH